MSDVQTNPPVTEPAPGLETGGHTESPTENPPVTAPNPALPSDGPTAPAEYVADASPSSTEPAGVPVPDSSYIAAELDAVVFGITSGVNNGVERVKSLIKYVEQHI
ncbi:hypothetical protein P0D88_34990 [Paraburkholderia sp. RL18-103-BIB-C]|uniref:hypothetical protein n=1 Tax=Paraburkholderia sp. RL18-103-BIB-C TaxID=3031637 RepID=UPI0038B766C3